MKILGTVTTGGKAYIVYWHEGDCITIPMLNVMTVTGTWDKEEALAICKRNYRNFVEKKEDK